MFSKIAEEQKQAYLELFHAMEKEQLKKTIEELKKDK